jgi:hypothetical protein
MKKSASSMSRKKRKAESLKIMMLLPLKKEKAPR